MEPPENRVKYLTLGHDKYSLPSVILKRRLL